MLNGLLDLPSLYLYPTPLWMALFRLLPSITSLIYPLLQLKCGVYAVAALWSCSPLIPEGGSRFGSGSIFPAFITGCLMCSFLSKNSYPFSPGIVMRLQGSTTFRCPDLSDLNMHAG